MNAKTLKGITVSFWTSIALLVATFAMSVYTAIQHQEVREQDTSAIPVPGEIR